MYSLKKVTMLGSNFKALRKQPEGSFLAKRDSKDSVKMHGNCKLIKRAAMFGLDARIALAIFGALSVISGAALYSAIQRIEATKYLRYFEETVKAHEQYFLENGEPLPTSGNYDSNIYPLIYNYEGLSTWNGPYLQGYRRINDSKISFILSGHWAQLYQTTSFLRKSDWTGNARWQNECLVDSTDCIYWQSIIGDPSHPDGNEAEITRNIFDKLDELVDDSDGAYTGRVRYTGPESGYYKVWYMDNMPVVRKV